MKKFYAILLVSLLSCSTAFAGSVFVKYNNAGGAIKYQEGAGLQQKFGQNAIYAPQTNQSIIKRNRQRKLEDAYYKQFENMNKHNVNININTSEQNTNNNTEATSNSSQESAADASANSSTETLENSNSSSNKTKEKRYQPKTINGVTYY